MPKEIKEKLARNIKILGTDPYHPCLRTKKLAGKLANMLSFRLNRDCRVIFCFIDANTIYVSNVEHRKDAYR